MACFQMELVKLKKEQEQWIELARLKAEAELKRAKPQNVCGTREEGVK